MAKHLMTQPEQSNTKGLFEEINTADQTIPDLVSAFALEAKSVVNSAILREFSLAKTGGHDNVFLLRELAVIFSEIPQYTT